MDRHHNPPTRLRIPDDHPILGKDVMRPFVLFHPRSDFDEEMLINLLRQSRTLTLEEKLSILKQIKVMSQRQIDTLMDTLSMEEEKFEFIVEEFPKDVAELVSERMEEIRVAVAQLDISNN